MSMEWLPYNKAEKVQSSREYPPSPVLENILQKGKIDYSTKVIIFGDGQGANTKALAKHVSPKNIKSINYEGQEVKDANNGLLQDTSVMMQQGDATKWDDLKALGLKEGAEDLVILIHVLEVPDIRGEKEKYLVQNITKVLKSGGEALVVQYKKKLSHEDAEKLGVEEIKEKDLISRFGENWKNEFKETYRTDWKEGMLYSEISNIRSKAELFALFKEDFEVKIEENESEFILKLKKK